MSERKFTGTVGRTYLDTDYRYEVEKSPYEGRPNVVYIVLDDLGFAGLGCYGSNIDTPNIDSLAQSGLRYNNFHTTAICSATRASLLTGANHHEVGVSGVIEMTTGCANGTGRIDDSYATIAEILQYYGYSTFASGKWHLSNQKLPAGPFNDWPLGKGFERFYGFLQGETDQFHPQLVRDNTFVEPPKSSAEGYHLSEDITDNAIRYIYEQKNTYPDKPFFLYLSYGAMHTPHHAPKRYIDKYKGRFDKGWDKLREEWFENQKKLGIIPQEAELTDRAPFVDSWDSLSGDKKRLYAKYMEAFAGFLDYTDEQIGRVIDYLKSIDQFDNTVIILISDNGASSEGGKYGAFNANVVPDIAGVSDGKEETAFALEHIDEIGGEYSFNHYPTGWANALNTPFQLYKCWAHEGGVKDPLIISYPKLIKDAGGIRSNYHHVSDVTPTVLDILGLEKPKYIKGVHQKPFSGVSFRYSFDSAGEIDRRRVQYYEMLGNRAIYKDGWKAVINHWIGSGGDFARDKWELYHVAEDYSEKYDVADKYPEKVKELSEEFLVEAAKYNVFPMTGTTKGRRDDVDEFEYNSGSPEAELVFKNMFLPFRFGGNGFEAYGSNAQNRVNLDSASHFIIADITVNEKDEGVIIASGDRFGGFTLYIKDRKVKYVYNANSFDIFKLESGELSAGNHSIRIDFTYVDRSHAHVLLSVDGKKSAESEFSRLYFMKGFTTAIRANYDTAVSPEYEVPFEFTGKINKIVLHSFAGGSETRKNGVEKAMHQE